MLPKVVRTERLVLRLPRLEDAEPIFESWGRDPEVARFLVQWPHGSIDDTRQFLQKILDDWSGRTSFQWVITKEPDDAPMGIISVRFNRHAAMVSYAVARSEWGKGYATEALQAVLDSALGVPGVYRAWAYCDLENRASARVMEKAGMLKEGILRRYARQPNISAEPRDAYVYAKVR